MEIIGSYNSHNIPLSSDDYATLFLYLREREVIIYFKRNEPYYHVEYVAVCMERTETYDRYDLYQHDYVHTNPEEVKSVIGEIVNALLR